MMIKRKRSFFERLTGSMPIDDDLEKLKSQSPFTEEGEEEPKAHTASKNKEEWLQNAEEGQLTVDVFQTPSEIIIQSAVAGSKPDDIDVSISSDMVTIRGKREKMKEQSGDDYYYQELYWGAFSRSILLPQEVDADESEATIKNGLLTIRLPKLDKNKTQKLKIKQE